MADNKESLIVLACVDPMSAGIYDYDTDKEYEAMKEHLEDILEMPIEMTTNVYPHDLGNRKFDLYVFDYGGMLWGCQDTVVDLHREFIKQAEDHPNSAFLIYSVFSSRWYNEIIEDEFDTKSQPNVILHHDYSDSYLEKLQNWFYS